MQASRWHRLLLTDVWKFLKKKQQLFDRHVRGLFGQFQTKTALRGAVWNSTSVADRTFVACTIPVVARCHTRPSLNVLAHGAAAETTQRPTSDWTMNGRCIRSMLTVWNISTTPSNLIRSSTMLIVMNTPVRPTPPLDNRTTMKT